jgi:peroxiredoxin/predicted 2-oxoglutarate/Fe(II)-dependent dioxygenase YbiX
MAKYRMLGVGDPAPWFVQRSTSSPDYHFSTAAGRYIVLCFFGTCADAAGRGMLNIVSEQRALFDDDKIAFFGVSNDAADESTGRVKERLPGVRHFWDFDCSVAKLYGSAPDQVTDQQVHIRRLWFVLDPTLRIRVVFAAKPDGSEREELAAYLKGLPPVELHIGFRVQAPVLVLPNVFEPELCSRLIELYETHGGEESGFMRDVDGKTVPVIDPSYKRRADYSINDEDLKTDIQKRFMRRVVPEMKKIHQYDATRMERYIVACYDSGNGGHFRAHRDNTTKGTAHRRFAVSINLNADFDGGEVSFPEYGSQSFKPPIGGAVVFSCSMLHAVSPLTRGKRYAFLPFLYDEAAAKIREANNNFLGESVGAYKQTG